MLLLRKGQSGSLVSGVWLFLSKKNSVSRIRREKSYMSAETSGQLICRGVGQNVSPRERTDISSVDREQNALAVKLNLLTFNLIILL